MCSWSRTSRGIYYRSYRCELKNRAATRCDSKMVNADDLESFVIELCKNINLEEIINIKKTKNNNSTLKRELTSLNKTLVENDKLLQGLVKKLALIDDIDILTIIQAEIKKIKSEAIDTKKVNTTTKIVKEGYDVKPIRSSAKVTTYKSYINPEEIEDKYDFITFVDGSYDRGNKIFGSGVIVLHPKDNSHDVYYNAGYDKWDQWNIVGELESVKVAINKAKELGKKNIAIYHDLKNIALWASGEWQAKNTYTQEYVKFMEDASKEHNICFVKVKAHSNESIYNDLADEAAKGAIIQYLNEHK